MALALVTVIVGGCGNVDDRPADQAGQDGSDPGIDPAPPAVIVGTRLGAQPDQIELLISSCMPMTIRSIEVFMWDETPEELPPPSQTIEAAADLTRSPSPVLVEIGGDRAQTVAVGFRTDAYPGVGDITEIAASSLDADRLSSEDGTLRTDDEFADLVTATCEGRPPS